MCRVLGVSASGFYARRKRPPSARSVSDAALTERIREVHKTSRQTYGSPRVHAELRAQGESVCLNRIARLMRRNDISARNRKRFVRTTDSDHNDPIAPNELNREFQTEEPNRAWVGDITYIATSEGWLFLAVVLDLFSRRVVGWAMADNMRKELVMSALDMALGSRELSGKLISHSDRGSQYTSDTHRQRLKDRRITCSMSRRGNCWDNAVAESFFGTLKTELIHRKIWRSRNEAREAVYEYIEVFYNRKRRHSTLGYVSPAEFERNHTQATRTAA